MTYPEITTQEQLDEDRQRMTDQLIDALAAVEAGEKTRQWFEQNFLDDGVLYVTHEQYRQILIADDQRFWRWRGTHLFGAYPEQYDQTPAPDSILVVIRETKEGNA